MANIVYPNEVLESIVEDILETRLNTRTLMTVDMSLSGAAGMKKVINRYTYTGYVESLSQGEKNTQRGKLEFLPYEYEVGVAQQVWDYYDEEVMKDPGIVNLGVQGMANAMWNDMNQKFFDELRKAEIFQTIESANKIAYDDIVDAIAALDLEDESQLYILCGLNTKAALRKNSLFTGAKQGEIIFTGQIGDISGLPVVYSKKVPADLAYVATKEAVTLFTKKDSEIEQERDKEARKNTIISRKVNLVALTNAKRLCMIGKASATPVLTQSSIAAGNNKAISGTNAAGAVVRVYVNDIPVGYAAVDGTTWTYTIDAVSSGDKVKVSAMTDGKIPAFCAAVTVS